MRPFLGEYPLGILVVSTGQQSRGTLARSTNFSFSLGLDPSLFIFLVKSFLTNTCSLPNLYQIIGMLGVFILCFFPSVFIKAIIIKRFLSLNKQNKNFLTYRPLKLLYHIGQTYFAPPNVLFISVMLSFLSVFNPSTQYL